MERRFDAIVLMPLAVIGGLALGLQFTAGRVPIELITQTVSLALGLWVALIIIEMIVRMAADVMLTVLADQDASEEAESHKGELTVFIVRDDEVIGQVQSWHVLPDQKKRGALTNRLRKLLARKATKDAKQ